jgi:hypothetical protein
MHDARFLRMQLHAQLAQNPKRHGDCRLRLLCECAGDYPVIGLPARPTNPAPHPNAFVLIVVGLPKSPPMPDDGVILA